MGTKNHTLKSRQMRNSTFDIFTKLWTEFYDKNCLLFGFVPLCRAFLFTLWAGAILELIRHFIEFDRQFFSFLTLLCFVIFRIDFLKRCPTDKQVARWLDATTNRNSFVEIALDLQEQHAEGEFAQIAVERANAILQNPPGLYPLPCKWGRMLLALLIALLTWVLIAYCPPLKVVLN